jgi:hypothetical protein
MDSFTGMDSLLPQDEDAFLKQLPHDAPPLHYPRQKIIRGKNRSYLVPNGIVGYLCNAATSKIMVGNQRKDLDERL